MLFQCRTQHFMWCNRVERRTKWKHLEVSMPHAAFYVVQLVGGYVCMTFSKVSMPHAAFYVVQLAELQGILAVTSFNAARSILCGATSTV